MNRRHIPSLLWRRIAMSLAALTVVVAAFTLYAGLSVSNAARGRIYGSVTDVPRNRVALLLGTNPLNRSGSPNTYFTNRIATAADLYHAGKTDYIIASGDNHTTAYDEPAAMRDSLIAHGIPASRIIVDCAGFRTLDSVVRAREVFGCDSLTIISQPDHCARALTLADAAGIRAVALAAPVKASPWVRARLAMREWLARDKMMLDLWMGRKPRFLGEKIDIPPALPIDSLNPSPCLFLYGRDTSRPHQHCPHRHHPPAAGIFPSLLDSLRTLVDSCDARIGIALIVDSRDTLLLNGHRDFPMLSVYKFPQALAVARHCLDNRISFDDSLTVTEADMHPDTWSPMRDIYTSLPARISIARLLAFTLQQSDNNACDRLFRLIGGPAVADSLMRSMGFDDIIVTTTEADMHRDPYLCYLNRSTPLAMAALFDRFNTTIRHRAPQYAAIAQLMEQCATGTDRLAKPLKDTGAVIAHKTGTGDINSQGRLIAVNDAGYVNLPDGHHYSIAVFIADSAHSPDATAAIIARISSLIHHHLTHHSP